MGKRIIISAVLASSFFSVANAVDTRLFGSIGTLGNIGFGSNNTLANESSTGYISVSGHIGVDVNISGFRMGIGVAGGFAPFTFGSSGTYVNNTFVGPYGSLFARPWVELSDFYLGYSNSNINFLVGRYNASDILYTADWVGGYNQGLAFAYESDMLRIWATYVNDVLRNGFNAYGNVGANSRYGMDLAGFGRFSSDWNDFNFRNELFAGGADIKIGELVRISPYAQYWLRDHSTDVLQVGIKAGLVFDLDFLRSVTVGRFLWSNLTSYNKNGFMWQIDQEFLLFHIIKLGGGYLSIGDVGLANNTIVDRMRFYGQYLYPYSYSGSGLLNRSYLYANVDTWYIFTGIKLADSFNLDVLYANGDYKEFSAIASYTIIGGEDQTDGIRWSVGGGFVTNDFGRANTAIAFTKLSF